MCTIIVQTGCTSGIKCFHHFINWFHFDWMIVNCDTMLSRVIRVSSGSEVTSLGSHLCLLGLSRTESGGVGVLWTQVGTLWLRKYFLFNHWYHALVITTLTLILVGTHLHYKYFMFYIHKNILYNEWYIRMSLLSTRKIHICVYKAGFMF